MTGHLQQTHACDHADGCAADHSRLSQAANTLFRAGMDTPDFGQAECCLRRACVILDCLCTVVSEDGKASYRKDSHFYLALLRGKLRLGQIAGYNGKMEDAFSLLREVATDDAAQLHASIVATQAVAWYDIGCIWISCGRPDQALLAFRQAVSTPARRCVDPHQPQQHQQDDLHLSRFLPAAMHQMELLMGQLEQTLPFSSSSASQGRLPPSTQPSWSIELIMPNLQQRRRQQHTCQNCHCHGAGNESQSVWAAGAA